MAFSNIRYGHGVIKEVGKDMANFKAKKVLLMTDKNVSRPTVMISLNVITVFHELLRFGITSWLP